MVRLPGAEHRHAGRVIGQGVGVVRARPDLEARSRVLRAGAGASVLFQQQMGGVQNSQVQK